MFSLNLLANAVSWCNDLAEMMTPKYRFHPTWLFTIVIDVLSVISSIDFVSVKMDEPASRMSILMLTFKLMFQCPCSDVMMTGSNKLLFHKLLAKLSKFAPTTIPNQQQQLSVYLQKRLCPRIVCNNRASYATTTIMLQFCSCDLCKLHLAWISDCGLQWKLDGFK